MSEAAPDAVHEIVETLAAETLSGEVANECYAEHKGGYVHVFVGGHPEDGFDEAHARAIAADLEGRIAPLGWFVAKIQFDEHVAADADEHPDESPQIMCFVDVFPLEGMRVVLPSDASRPHAWHVAPRSARDGIAGDGLVPSTGGSDFIVTRNARIYVCIDEDDAQYFAADMRRLRDDWDEWDLWRIDLTAVPDHLWRDDVEAPSISAWTDLPIPATALLLAGGSE